VNTVMNLRFHRKAGYFLISWVTKFSNNILHHGVRKFRIACSLCHANVTTIVTLPTTKFLVSRCHL
jgi:hypothetical protein